MASSSSGMTTPSVERAFMVLCIISVLSYVDRGIIAGCSALIKGCVHSEESCAHVPKIIDCDGKATLPCGQCRICGDVCEDELVKQTGFGIDTEKLGVLQSAFMIGYCVASVVNGNLVHRYMPFRLVGFGLGLWLIAVILSGVSGFLCDGDKEEDSDKLCFGYWVMLVGRMLSGVGEAALACIAFPFLDDVLPANKKGRYFGIYFASIPVGTALGFVWSGMLSSALGRWELAFLLEAPVMIPFAIICWYFPFKLRTRDVPSAIAVESSETEATLEQSLVAHDVISETEHLQQQQDAPVPFFVEVRACLSSPVFLLTSFGYACFTYTSAGLAFYTPTFIQNYRPCDDAWGFGEKSADLIFGVIVVFSGFIGTFLGGIVLDHHKVIAAKLRLPYRGDDLVTHALQIASVEVVIGTTLCMTVFVITNPYPFFALYALAVGISFLTAAPINTTILGSVPVKHRSMSMAISLIILHAFGDVPSPVIIGMIADKHSPLFTLASAIINMAAGGIIWIFACYWSARSVANKQPRVSST